MLSSMARKTSEEYIQFDEKDDEERLLNENEISEVVVESGEES